MPEEYLALVAALKALSQVETTASGQTTIVLSVAEDEWETRPDTVSYGIVSLDFERRSLDGCDRKQSSAYEGSVDLFSMVRSGAGWVELICNALNEHCGATWRLNSHTYERETGLFHWEWTYEVIG